MRRAMSRAASKCTSASAKSPMVAPSRPRYWSAGPTHATAGTRMTMAVPAKARIPS